MLSRQPARWNQVPENWLFQRNCLPITKLHNQVYPSGLQSCTMEFAVSPHFEAVQKSAHFNPRFLPHPLVSSLKKLETGSASENI